MTGFTPEFQQALDRFIADAPGGITINSGYRSVERQQQLWDEALQKYGSPEAARKWVAPPGNSQHNYGRAADLGYASPDVRAWAHENAANYGLNFPMSWEPWHVEPVGARSQPMNAQPGPTNALAATGGDLATRTPPGDAPPDAASAAQKMALFNALRNRGTQQDPNAFMMPQNALQILPLNG